MGFTRDKGKLLSKRELLDIFVHHRVDSPFPGDWESIFKGGGYEFWSLRELGQSEPFRHIDWKATAKTGRYHVREYLAETYFNLMILYDISGSVGIGRKELLQANIAVSLAYSAALSNNGCGLILFADKVEGYFPPRMGWSHFFRLVSAIVETSPLAGVSTNLDAALDKLVGAMPESLAFILSDFMYPVRCRHGFAHQRRRRHEVKAIQVLDPAEVSIAEGASGLVLLYDAESGEETVLDLSKWRQYNEKMKRFRDENRKQLSLCGIDSAMLTPEDNFVEKINAFMRKETGGG